MSNKSKSIYEDLRPATKLASEKENGPTAGKCRTRNEDEERLAKLGYVQELKRIFGAFTNFGLTVSQICVLLGVIPLYGYQLRTGGTVIFFWSWLIVGIFSLSIVISLAEICSAFPTMGALYYWAYKLGGPDWGIFSSWMTGWLNLLGQIAGVSSGSYSGAIIIADIVYMLIDNVGCGGRESQPAHQGAGGRRKSRRNAAPQAA